MDGFTKKGLELLQLSRDMNTCATIRTIYELPDHVRLLSIWSLAQEQGTFYCDQEIVPTGEVYKIVNAIVYKNKGIYWREGKDPLWITAGRLVTERAPFWAIPTELLNVNEVALICDWEHVPEPVWIAPGFMVPAPIHRIVHPNSNILIADPTVR